MSNPYSQKLRSSKAFLLAVLFTILSVVQTIGQTFSSVPLAVPHAATGNEDFTPLGTFWGFQRSQMQYNNTELTAGGMTAGGKYITQVGFWLNSSDATKAATTPVVIHMRQKNGAAGLVSSLYSTAVSGYSQVFSGNLNSSAWVSGSWVMVTLTTPFYYVNSGTSNLEVMVETNFGGSGTGTFASTQWLRTLPASNQLQTWNADGQPSIGLGVLSSDRPDIRLGFYAETACSAPGVLNAVSSLSNVCTTPSQQFTLSLTGIPFAPPAIAPGGYTFVWQSSAAIGGPYVPIAGAPNAPTFATTQASTTFYNCIVTCGTSSTSTVVQVSSVSCYCVPSTNFTNDTDIGQVTFGTLNNPAAPGPTTNNPLASNSYTDYTLVSPPSFAIGTTNLFKVTQITSGGTFWQAVAHVFIDWNQDGDFVDAAEHVFLPGPTGPQGTTPTTTFLTTNITIPWSATIGQTRMRVVLRETCCGSAGGPTNGPCDIFNWGEIEDYTIKITTSGVPSCNVLTPGTATTTLAAVCPNQPFTLDLTGYSTFGTGMSFQWQSTTTPLVPASWTSIAGATSFPFTVASQSVWPLAGVYYRLQITCPANGIVYSSNVFVAQNAPALCSCPVSHLSCPSDPFITDVTLVGTPLPLTNLNSGCTSGNGLGWTVFPPTGTNTTTVVAGSGPNLTIKTAGFGNAIISVWIDCNPPDGVFMANEWMQVSTNLAPGVPITIPLNSTVLPSTAVPGLCAMRIRSRASGNQNDANSACIPMFSGEAEDYIINIQAPAPTPCSAVNFTPRTITTLQATSNVCSGTQINFNLTPSLTSPILYSGITFLWNVSTDGGVTWSPAPGVNSTVSYSGSFSQNTLLQCVLTCGAIPLTYTPSIAITTIPSTWLGFDDDWSNGTNWCGRVPKIIDPAQINKTVALTLRAAGNYFSPVGSIRDTVTALSLNISNLDSMTLITDTLLSVNIAKDVVNDGGFAVLSAQAADTATIGSVNVVTPSTVSTFGQIFRGKENDEIYQIIYNNSELSGIGMQAGNIVDSLLFQFRNRGSSPTGFQNFTISYQVVPAATLSAFASTAPYTGGSFIPIYTAPTLNTAAPLNGQWTPYTSPNVFAFTGTINVSGILNGLSPVNPFATGVLVGDLVTGPNIPLGATVTAVTTSQITISPVPTATSAPNTPFTVTNSGGWLRLATNLNPFIWNGTDNILLQICFNNGAANASYNDEMYMTSTAPIKTTVYLSNAAAGAANNGCLLNTGSGSLTSSFGQSPGTNRPNITFRFRNPQRRLTANIGGQVLNNLTGKMWLSSSDIIIGSNLVNSGSLYIQDSSYTQIAGDVTNNGSLIGSNLALTKKPAVQFNGINWINNGTMTPGNSRVTFGTAGSQIIGGTNPSAFYDFNMQKTGNADIITMNKSFTVADSLTLRFGQLRMNKNQITVTNSNVGSISRQPTGAAFAAPTSSTPLTSGVSFQVTLSSVAGIGIGDLIYNATGLSTSPPAHVVGVNGSVVTFSPVATGAALAGATYTFYKAGYLIGEDSLSKVNLLVDAIPGYRSIPFANITTNGAANPLHIPVNFNLAALNAVDMDTVSFATYKAPANLPWPPTVNQLNSGGPANKVFIGNTTIGSNIITSIASTAGVALGDQVSGPGIPLGALVTSFTGTTITFSPGVATATAITVIINTGIVGVGAGGNNDLYTGERFWILNKTSAPVKLVLGNTNGTATISGITPNTTGISIGQTIFGTGIPPLTVVTGVTATTVTMSLASTSAITGNNIAFNYPLTNLSFTLAYDERPCPNGSNPYTCASGSNLLRPQPWYVQTFPDLQGTWKRLQFTGTPYLFTLPGFTNALPNVNFNVGVNNYPWIYGNYNPWTISTASQPLPIELISFDANLKGEDVLLDWSTATEKNNDYFTIERTLDFDNIVDIAKVKSNGDGTSSRLQNYTAWDFEPIKGAINYYRLRQTDIDGTTTIASDYVPVRIGLKSVFEIKYVNTDNTIDVFFDYDSSLPVNYTLYDLSGRIIANGSGLAVQQGINMLKINGATLARGMYMIKLSNKEKSVTSKFVF